MLLYTLVKRTNGGIEGFCEFSDALFCGKKAGRTNVLDLIQRLVIRLHFETSTVLIGLPVVLHETDVGVFKALADAPLCEK
jgi:hypothetical protein